MDNFASQLINTLLSLAFVIALAWVSIGLLKRLQQGRAGGGKGRDAQAELRFVRALPVGAKERVVVMHFRGEEWVLGVAPGGISLLSRQPLPSTLGINAPSAPPSAPVSGQNPG